MTGPGRRFDPPSSERAARLARRRPIPSLPERSASPAISRRWRPPRPSADGRLRGSGHAAIAAEPAPRLVVRSSERRRRPRRLRGARFGCVWRRDRQRPTTSGPSAGAHLRAPRRARDRCPDRDRGGDRRRVAAGPAVAGPVRPAGADRRAGAVPVRVTGPEPSAETPEPPRRPSRPRRRRPARRRARAGQATMAARRRPQEPTTTAGTAVPAAPTTTTGTAGGRRRERWRQGGATAGRAIGRIRTRLTGVPPAAYAGVR